GIQSRADLTIDLPNPYEILVRNSKSEAIELPWDFARHFCEQGYRERVERVALAGRHTLGDRIRGLREATGMTQEALARSAGIGRATVARLEKGEYSPRLETLSALAGALQRPIESLLL